MNPLYPRIVRAVDTILANGKVVAPVDVLVRMGLLAPDHVEDWRRGRVPYLEQVINCNVTRLSRLLRILRFHAHDLNLKPSWTAYRPSAGPEGNNGTTARKVDLDKLRVALRKMGRGSLSMVAERAIEIAPKTKLPALVGDM